ncbi:MAG TPA: membrane-bound O-acyltransferase family protein [Flavobacteriales bacterium]|mgnify:CR=1 FL=1|nr:membrane-bound O-acyltransferase family protein [Flavobacteriales bacterium]
MVFNSLPFLIFFPIVLLMYYILPHRLRWILLLIASYVFYGFWKLEYLALIVFSTIIDYFVARFLHTSENRFNRRIALLASLSVNLGLLFFFKYSNFFIEDVLHPTGMISENAVNVWTSNWDFLLPVGISFYTFQTMSYSIDVYYKKVIPETNIFKLALFVSFFPQLVAGPIERFSRLHHQLFQSVTLSSDQLLAGGRLMLYGLFIKMCVANNVAPIVDQIFNDFGDASTLQLWIGMVLFGIQIFADFNGYSLIAIGAARCLGIRLIDNFDSPYSAISIQSFWSKWHISLSTWFRDYVFIPMGGSRVSAVRLGANILVVFIVSGIWHGANWTFVVWGAIHGIAYLAERYSGMAHSPNPLFQPVRWLTTMLVVFVAWVFFRIDSVGHGFDYVQGLFSTNTGELSLIWHPITISFVGLFLLSDTIFRAGNIQDWLAGKSLVTRWTVYSFMIYGILAHAGTVNHPFIYFQF